MIFKKIDNNRNIILVDGFSFSGSGLLIDILLDNGYHAPKNIRMDEVNDSSLNFSWSRLIKKDYSYSERFIITLRILRTLIVRVILNPIQLTPFYKYYLSCKNRNLLIHESTSVNRAIKSYLLSIVLIIKNKNPDEEYFYWWFKHKYNSSLKYENLLLDNGISYDSKILDWQSRYKNSTAFIVYRNPRIQFQQIKSYYAKNQVLISNYSDFLDSIILNYESKLKYISDNQILIPVSFDLLLDDSSYRKKLFYYLKENLFVEKFNYDFQNSQKNNRSLKKDAEKCFILEFDLLKEKKIESIFENFNAIFKNRISRIK